MLCDVGWGMRVFKRGQCCVYSDTAEESGIDIYTKLCETVHPLPSSLRVPFQVELVSLRFLSLFHPYLFAIAPPFLRRPFPSCSGCGIPCWRHPTSKPSLQAYRSAHLLHPRTTFWSYIYLFLRSKLPSVSHLSAFYLEAVFRTLHFLPSCLKWTHINKNKSPWLPSHEAFSAHARVPPKVFPSTAPWKIRRPSRVRKKRFWISSGKKVFAVW